MPLKATNLSEAREAHRKLLVQRSEGDSIYYGECQKFGEYAQQYLEQQQGRKTKGTLVVKRGHIRFWTSRFGQVRLNHITPAKVRAGLTELVNRGNLQQTRNLAVTMLRNVLNMAITDHLIRHLPTTKDMNPNPRRP